MSQDKKPASTQDLNDWLQQLLVPITAAQDRIREEIDHGCLEDKRDGWLKAQKSLEEAVKRIDDIAAIPIPSHVEQSIVRQATFPELNPNPVLEIDLDGDILFTNLATRDLFPDILEKKYGHPFLAGIDQIIKDAINGLPRNVTRDIQTGDHYFRQSIFYIKEYACLRVYAMDITRHIQTEESLRRSQNLLRAVMDGAPDPIFMKDRNSRMLMANPATVAVVGKSLEKIIGKTDAEFYDDPAMGQAIMENDQKVMETGQTQVIEERVVMADGEHIFLSTKTPYRDHTGNVIAIIGVARDITERKQREEELDRLNRTLRAISNCNQALMRVDDETNLMNEVCKIIVRDCGHAMVWIGRAENDEAKKVRAMASAGFEEGYLDTLRVTWADDERGRGPTGTAIRTGQISMCRNMLTDPAFKPWRAEALKRGYASSIVFPIFVGGETIGALTIYSRKPDPFSEPEVSLLSELTGDLAYGISTIRLRAAQAQAAEALRFSEERYHSLFTGMSEGYALHEMIYDEQGTPSDYRFLDINPAFERLTSLKREEVIGKRYNQVLPDDDPRWVKIYGQVALTGTPVHFENYSPALKQHYEVFAYRPAADQFAVLFLNITERKNMEEQLHQAHLKLEQRVQERTQALAVTNEELKNEIEVTKKVELELRESEARLTQALDQEQTLRSQLIQAEKNSALARMVASVAHEINNPIQTIKNCLYLLENQVDPALNSNEILAMAYSETSRIGDLVGRLREVYKPSRDQNPKPFNILEVLGDVQALLKPHLQAHNINWSLSTDTECPMVNGVADQIKQVFLNISLTGIDAMEDHGGRLTVVVSTANLCQVNISFNDTGKGIPADDLPQVFEPFFTTKEKGAGLGLSICYDIVRNFNGNIFATSTPGEGATFTVSLPRA